MCTGIVGMRAVRLQLSRAIISNPQDVSHFARQAVPLSFVYSRLPNLAVYFAAIPWRGPSMRHAIVMLVVMLPTPMRAQNGNSTWMQMAARAVQQSKLTLPGSRPFHLKAEIVEPADPASSFRAKIEEYWVSPEKWRRTIESPAFSQTIVVNADRVLEIDTGDYFPWWLEGLVIATFDPLPNVAMPTEVNPKANKIVPPQISGLCTQVQIAGDKWSLCFDPRRTLLTNAFNLSTGYDAEFKDFHDFGNKQVARRIVRHPEPGLNIQETITLLEGLPRVVESMFVIEQSTPPQERIARVRIDEESLRKLSLTSTEIDWPYVGGPVTGGCAVYISADRSGHIREAWPGGCDNTGLEDRLRDQVMKWQLKPTNANEVPVQVESRLTFTFKMKPKPTEP